MVYEIRHMWYISLHNRPVLPAVLEAGIQARPESPSQIVFIWPEKKKTVGFEFGK